jgi:hypothetical protein
MVKQLLTIMLLLSMALSASAKKVSVATAKTVAASFLRMDEAMLQYHTFPYGTI